MITVSSERLTLQKIADMVGVSKTIVSKVVNHVPHAPVSVEKRAKIEAIVKEYNYTPLGAARSLATQRTHQVSFMLSSHCMLGLENQYVAKMLNGVCEACDAHGYQCVINQVDCSDVGTFMMPDNLRKKSIDGCILVGYYDTDVLRQLVSVHLPLVMLGCGSQNPGIPCVSQDEEEIFGRILDFLCSRGHRRIGVASGSHLDRLVFERVSRSHSGCRLSFPDRQGCYDDYLFGQRTAEEFLSLGVGSRPTVYYGSIHFCVSFLQAIELAGLHCPEDVSVFTGVDSELSRWFHVPLTGTSMDLRQMSHDSAELLVELIEGVLTPEEACEQAQGMRYSVEIHERSSVRNLS